MPDYINPISSKPSTPYFYPNNGDFLISNNNTSMIYPSEESLYSYLQVPQADRKNKKIFEWKKFLKEIFLNNLFEKILGSYIGKSFGKTASAQLFGGLCGFLAGHLLGLGLEKTKHRLNKLFDQGNHDGFSWGSFLSKVVGSTLLTMIGLGKNFLLVKHADHHGIAIKKDFDQLIKFCLFVPQKLGEKLNLKIGKFNPTNEKGFLQTLNKAGNFCAETSQSLKQRKNLNPLARGSLRSLYKANEILFRRIIGWEQWFKGQKQKLTGKKLGAAIRNDMLFKAGILIPTGVLLQYLPDFFHWIIKKNKLKEISAHRELGF